MSTTALAAGGNARIYQDGEGSIVATIATGPCNAVDVRGLRPGGYKAVDESGNEIHFIVHPQDAERVRLPVDGEGDLAEPIAAEPLSRVVRAVGPDAYVDTFDDAPKRERRSSSRASTPADVPKAPARKRTPSKAEKAKRDAKAAAKKKAPAKK